MKKSQFTDSQIVAILKEAGTGIKVSDVCRKHGISQPTYYNWKSKYGGEEKEQLLAAEKSKASVRVYVEHPFHVLKNLFGLGNLVLAARRMG